GGAGRVPRVRAPGAADRRPGPPPEDARAGCARPAARAPRGGDGMSTFKVDVNMVFEASGAAVSQIVSDLVEHDPDAGPPVVPGELPVSLPPTRLLTAVPFSAAVPDARLLPTGATRFFSLDRRWTDALVQGALGVGTITTADRAQLEAVYPAIR